MKKKVIAGIFCALAGIAAVWLISTISATLPLATLVLSIMTMYEINHAVGIKNIPFKALTYIGASSFSVYYFFKLFWETGYKFIDANVLNISLIYALVALFIMLTDFEDLKMGKVTTSFLMSLLIPFAITRYAYFYLDNPYFETERSHCVFLILFTMFCAWITDVFAYFAGSFWGKHKLCPKISPKKTVEGAIGGALGGAVISLILYAIFENFIFTTQNGNYVEVFVIAFVLSIFGMCGDLTFSVLKRNYDIKDFSNLVPGHGGVMDRFDSEVFVLLAFYAITNIFKVVF